jgi:ubiquinone/menaquinone biosynthesis C-methylase UbiE
MNKMQDPNYLLTDQYKDDTNLNARIRIHELFSTNKQGFHRWAFDQLRLPPNSKILELGCGPGQLWLKNLDRIPEGWDITLTDFSPGMIDAAQRNLGDRFHYQVADAQQLPFEENTFDCVIANYMLYHVPDRPRAFSEIRRVLRPEGRFYAATLGRDHLKEIGELIRDFDPNLPALGGQTAEAFTLENGREQIEQFFPNVKVYEFDDALEVTEPEPLVSYILSGLPGGKLSGWPLSALRSHVKKALDEHNPFHVTKVSGIFEAVNHKERSMSARNLEEVKQHSREIWDQNATVWDATMGSEGNAFQRVLLGPSTERLLDLKPGETVLDIACGNGSFARRMAQLGAHVVATDFSRVFLERAKERTTEHADRIEYRLVDATDEAQLLALGEHRFDAAVCTMGIMDIADIETLASCLPKLLKPRARFVFSVMHPCFNSGSAMMLEEVDIEGTIVSTYSVKVSQYLGLKPVKGLGIMNQPVPQYYFYRPLHSLLGTFFKSGLVLDGLEEPAFPGDNVAGSGLGWGRFHEIPPALVARLRLP